MVSTTTPLGLYVSIPFCRAKCSFCNFASDAFAPGRMPPYLDALGAEIGAARGRAERMGTALPDAADTMYIGGGTPSLLKAEEVRRIFARLRAEFAIAADAEITVECAPGQLSEETLAEFERQGVNRLSFGVQSFADRESAAVGRQHTAEQCLAEIERVQRAGIVNLSLDLIAGLPHQTEASWRSSLDAAIASGVPHVSLYMLEVDEDSRLGREMLSAGERYGAGVVPSDDKTAVFYEIACGRLEGAGIAQYEISNFARDGFRSRHNLKYWRRLPYLGFGLDAHSMLLTPDGSTVRFANPEELAAYEAVALGNAGTEQAKSGLAILGEGLPEGQVDRLTTAAVFEETLFLGLRVNEGMRLTELRQSFSDEAVRALDPLLLEAEEDGLLLRSGDRIALTLQGRLLSNELFGRLLAEGDR